MSKKKAFAEPLLIDNISKSFGDKKVLDNVSFEVGSREIFGLVGLNGIGKTTLIKIILDLLKQDGGKVHIFGKEPSSKEARKNLIYLPEKFQPSHYLKGKEFLEISEQYFDEKLDLKRAKAIARNLALDENALELKVSKYSKGMTQKLGLIATFLTKARLIILDEPMSGLDPRARIHLKDQLIKAKKEGYSIFFSSHILADIDEICDRIAVLHDSKVVFNGTPADFKKKHKEKSLERAFLKEI